ncbi:MAG: hypothetical protein CMJ64_11925 [Planctomycetaceae bacterium]|nr:hypothetical protein [Planctomycetaceae bacterium]
MRKAARRQAGFGVATHESRCMLPADPAFLTRSVRATLADMPTVFLPTQLRDLTGGVARIEADGASIREVLDQLERRFPGVRARLCEDDGLLPSLQISVDNTSTRKLSTKVQSTSEVHFLPAIGGG